VTGSKKGGTCLFPEMDHAVGTGPRGEESRPGTGQRGTVMKESSSCHRIWAREEGGNYRPL